MKGMPLLKKSEVILVRGDDRYKNTAAILEKLKEELVPKVRGQNVLIKPNLVYDKRRTGVTTHPKVVKAVVDFLARNCDCAHVAIGDGSSVECNTRKAFRSLGYTKTFKDVELLDLNEDEYKEVVVRDPLTKQPLSIPLSNTALDSWIISCALLKTHDYGIATFSLKNMVGCIVGEGKRGIHGGMTPDLPDEEFRACVKQFHKNIYAVLKKIAPALSLIDGTIGLEGNGPIMGRPIKVGVGLGGFDPVAVDAVSAYLIGLDPFEIGYLYYCDGDLGNADLSKIEVRYDEKEEEWRRFRKTFRTHRDYYRMTFTP